MVDGKPAEGEFLMADGSTSWKRVVTQILVMEAEVPVDAPVDVTNEAVIEVDGSWSTKCWCWWCNNCWIIK
jgi:hypothetical protein